MKKILCLALSLIMLVSLCSCMGGTDDIRGEISNNNSETDPKFSMGKSSGNKYHSDFLGLSITVPDTWTFYSDEEILALNNLTTDIYSEEVLEILENATLVYDMFVANESTGSNINVNLEKITLAQSATYDAKKVIEGTFDILTSTLENMGCSNIEIGYKQFSVDGKQVDGYEASCDIYGYEYNIVGLMLKRGTYLASVTFSGYGADEINEMLSWVDFD